MKERADRLLVERGLFDSRAAARAAIEAGRVSADGVIVGRPSQRLDLDAAIKAQAAHPWVSRGGVKLAHGLDVFGVRAEGRVCLDIGASTGGFTEVLRTRGATHVTAVDVGRGQIHPRMAADLRVTVLEGTDARALAPGDLPAGPPSLIVADVSFIALEKVLPVPLSLAAAGAALVALFKPQFEVGRPHVGRGGIVRDAGAVQCAEAALAVFLAARGWPVIAWADSPIPGGDGNRERLFHARRA